MKALVAQHWVPELQPGKGHPRRWQAWMLVPQGWHWVHPIRPAPRRKQRSQQREPVQEQVPVQAWEPVQEQVPVQAWEPAPPVGRAPTRRTHPRRR